MSEPQERIRRYLAERERLAASATGGPWRVCDATEDRCRFLCSGTDEEHFALVMEEFEVQPTGNFDFIADARSAVPTLARMLALTLEALERIPARKGGLMCCACDTADELATDALAALAALLPEEGQ